MPQAPSACIHQPGSALPRAVRLLIDVWLVSKWNSIQVAPTHSTRCPAAGVALRALWGSQAGLGDSHGAVPELLLLLFLFQGGARSSSCPSPMALQITGWCGVPAVTCSTLVCCIRNHDHMASRFGVHACGRWLRPHRLCVPQGILLSCCMCRQCSDTDTLLQASAAHWLPNVHVVSMVFLDSASLFSIPSWRFVEEPMSKSQGLVAGTPG